MGKKLKPCPFGPKRCVCSTSPEDLAKLGYYCPYDPKDAYKGYELVEKEER